MLFGKYAATVKPVIRHKMVWWVNQNDVNDVLQVINNLLLYFLV